MYLIKKFQRQLLDSNVIKRLYSGQANMTKSIKLTEREATLQQLLLDVSSYSVTVGRHHTKPELRFAGGWVRDKLLGLSSKDIDVAISNMTGVEFGFLMKQYMELPEALGKYDDHTLGRLAKIQANPEKSKHLETATTKILGLDVDLVNLRKETYTDDSRTPTFEFGTPKEDALRRDSTINALFYNLQTSKVEDLTERGLEDIKRKIIKTPLDPLQTFKDDPLRILRCIRFASRLRYEIDPEDENAMRNSSITDALRNKISRERVRDEILKMLGWPKPYQSLSLLEGGGAHKALSLIDRLGLYNEVFTDPTDNNCKRVDIMNWHWAYDQLRDITKAGSEGSSLPSPVKSIQSILLRNPDDMYHAWILTCFIPWASEPPKSEPKSPKRSVNAASLAARKGIKAENTIYRLVDDAVSHLRDIIEMKDAAVSHLREILEKKDAVSDMVQTTTVPSKRKQSANVDIPSTGAWGAQGLGSAPNLFTLPADGIQRETQGLAIRRWGFNWRSSVMYALLTEVAEARIETEAQAVLDGYSSWLSRLSDLDLLNVGELDPIVNGNEIMKAFDTEESGKWVSVALDWVIKWQLRNPYERDKKVAIAEVVKRKEELDIPAPNSHSNCEP